MIGAGSDKNNGVFSFHLAKPMHDLPCPKTKTLLCCFSQIVQNTCRHFDVAFEKQTIDLPLVVEITNKAGKCGDSGIGMTTVKSGRQVARVNRLVRYVHQHIIHPSSEEKGNLIAVVDAFFLEDHSLIDRLN